MTARGEPVAPPLAGPSGVGAIADRAAALYRRDFPLLFSTAFLPHAGLYLVSVALLLLGSSHGLLGESAVQFFRAANLPVLLVCGTFLNVLQGGALTWVTARRYLGHEVGLAEAFRVGLRLWFRVFATKIMGTVVTTAGFLAGMVLGGLAAAAVIVGLGDPVVGPVLALMVFVPFLALGFFFFLRFLFADYLPVATVMEGQWALDALRRSWSLMGWRSPRWGRFAGNVYRVTALFLLLLGIYLAFVFLAQVPNYAILFWRAVEQVRSGVPPTNDPTFGAPLYLLIPAQLIAVTAQALILPFTAAVLTVYYYDIRVRREGFDLFLRVSAGEAAQSGGLEEATA